MCLIRLIPERSPPPISRWRSRPNQSNKIPIQPTPIHPGRLVYWRICVSLDLDELKQLHTRVCAWFIQFLSSSDPLRYITPVFSLSMLPPLCLPAKPHNGQKRCHHTSCPGYHNGLPRRTPWKYMMSHLTEVYKGYYKLCVWLKISWKSIHRLRQTKKPMAVIH